MTPDTPAVIVVTGVMAAGKSTVAHHLTARLPRSAHVRGDTFRRMIVSDRHELEPVPTAEATAQLWLRYRLAAQVADGYAQAGFTTVVQDVILGPDLAAFVPLITTRPRFVVVLAPHPSVVTRREQARPKQGYGTWTVAALDDSLRHDTPRRGLWLDTSDQTPDETATEILARLPEAAW